jgi:hypothetical protein
VCSKWGVVCRKTTVAHRTRTTRESSTFEKNEKAAQDQFE